LLTKDLLIDFLASRNLSQQDKVLFILLSQDGNHLSARNIQSVALAHGVKQITAWNVPRTLANAYEKGYAVKMPEGWILTPSGRKYVRDTYLPNDPVLTREVAVGLRSHLDKISSPDTREFVAEAIGCLEADLKRSAVVMSWIGAISVLYDFVIANRLADFNAKAKDVKRDWKPAVTKDDLARMKESEFLDILAQLSVIGGSVKEELKSSLRLRNSCGHPNSYQIGKHQVQHHIEFLILNVFGKF
jgi:hypothetical protein